MIPRGLEQYPNFILYKLVPDGSKYKKLPVSPHTLEVIDAHDRAHWVDAEHAKDRAGNSGLGIAFVFSQDVPRVFIDLDDCLGSDDETWSEFAVSICKRLPQAAIEVSSSGRGLHIFAAYSGELPYHSTQHKDANGRKIMEFYSKLRFVALTGTGLQGDASVDYTDEILALIHEYLNTSEVDAPGDWTTGPVPEWRGPDDDAELLSRALKAQSAASIFGARASFKELFEGNVEALIRAYPAQGHRADNLPYDASAADSALAVHLAFWTGKDCERIKRIMSWSGLARPKWEREDYLPRTITRACATARNVYQETSRATGDITNATPGLTATEIAPREGVPFMSVDEQLKYFAGCVYVSREHAVMTPGGNLLKPEQFRASYGGYIFNMDRENHKTTNNAWDAFIGSFAFRAPRVDATTFRPAALPGAIIQEEGLAYVNSYWPARIETSEADVGPFLRHLEKLLPLKEDRAIILAYMAALVQYPGVKFQWCPLIQGVEGNGKSFLSYAMARAVGRRYSYAPKAKEMAERFNDWVYGRIFIYVEDVYVPEKRIDFMETLKPMITNRVLEIEGKGAQKFTGEICANFMLNTNHKDALKKTANDRRFAPFYTPQQHAADLVKWAMNGAYFPRLYDWADYEGGWAAIAGYLQRYEIPDELNPATRCHRAPVTSNTVEAISLGLGPIEQEIREAIEEEREGFRGGWISSHYVDALIRGLKAERAIPRNKRRDLLNTLGYDLHPGLPGGRVNYPVQPDNAKPRLYLLVDHPALKLTVPSEIADAYRKAQMPS